MNEAQSKLPPVGVSTSAGSVAAQNQQAVIQELIGMRREQDAKHTDTHSVAEWLHILEVQLQKAKAGWYAHGDGAARYRVAQIGACAIACLEQNKSH